MPNVAAHERLALLHAEPVLLIDDDEPERCPCSISSEQRVGADEERHSIERRWLARRRHEHRSSDVAGQEPLGRGYVLLGKQLRRREPGDTFPSLQGRIGSDEGHDRLAAPDVAEQQPGHRGWALKILQNLPAGSPLGVGQLEGE